MCNNSGKLNEQQLKLVTVSENSTISQATNQVSICKDADQVTGRYKVYTKSSSENSKTSTMGIRVNQE